MFVRTLAAASAVAVAATILAGCGTASGPGLALPQYQSAQSAARDSSFQSLRQLPDRIAPPKAKMLYLADRNAAAIIGFPANANGNVAPSVAIKGEATGLTNPVALTVDTAGRLLAINDSGNEVLIFPKGASGDAAPPSARRVARAPVRERRRRRRPQRPNLRLQLLDGCDFGFQKRCAR